MSYTSPLGCNFKLAQSLLASQENEEKKYETPKRNESWYSECGSGSGKRNSRNGRNFQFDNSSSFRRSSNTWKTPNAREEQRDPLPVTMFYHPSMLENPWEELEKDLGGNHKLELCSESAE